MSSVYWPLPVMNLWSSLRRTAAPIPVALMAFPPSGIVSTNCSSASLGQLFSSHRLGAGGDRFRDVGVPGAAADVAFELVPDGLVVEVVALAVDQVDRRHDHPGSAEAALQAVILAEGLLHRVEPAVLREPLDRGDVRTFRLPGGHGAGRHRLA